MLSSIDDCNYHFDWYTSVICPPHECSFSPDTCEMVQDDLGMRYNFKNASFTKDGKIEVSFYSKCCIYLSDFLIESIWLDRQQK